ncbi:MAG: TauD/TfdA family dioxygenase, partial [SAR324 cluster bacterium]|nr:TauD/TfdA family dioxygenase [SAR324 cluster bacterium]
LLEQQPSERLERPIESALAWTNDSISPDDCTLPLSTAALGELEQVVEALRREPLPTYLLSPDFFQLSACRSLMGEVRRRLTEGLGFVLLEGFPLDGLSQEETRAAYWVLGRLLSQPVAAKLDGTVLYDVRDMGRAYGIGVRASLTSTELEFHTDNTFAAAPPDYVSLLCIQPAHAGGESRIASFCTLHNELLGAYPRLLERLYEPFYYDRQLEHGEGEPRVSISRAFSYNGEFLRGRLSYNVMKQGYQLMGEEMDAQGREALDTAYALLNEPRHWTSHTLRRGQIQFLNNRATAHARTAFDDAGASSGRHLLRLWYRDEGRPFFNG